MKTALSRIKLSLLSACLLATGCATQNPAGQAAGECAAGGGIGGYALCKLMGNSDQTCVGVAAAAAVVAGAGCFVYSSQLEKRRQELAGHENDLNAQLKYVRGLNEDGEKANALLRDRVTAATKRTTDLSAQISKKQATTQQLAAERKRLDDDLQEANKQLALQKDAVTEVKTYQAKRKTPSADLDAEVAKQDRLLAETQKQVVTLASLRERV